MAEYTESSQAVQQDTHHGAQPCPRVTLPPTSARVLIVCQQTHDACVRLQIAQSSTTEVVLNVPLWCRAKGKLRDVVLSQQSQGIACRTYLLQQAAKA